MNRKSTFWEYWHLHSHEQENSCLHIAADGCLFQNWKEGEKKNIKKEKHVSRFEWIKMNAAFIVCCVVHLYQINKAE